MLAEKVSEEEEMKAGGGGAGRDESGRSRKR